MVYKWVMKAIRRPRTSQNDFPATELAPDANVREAEAPRTTSNPLSVSSDLPIRDPSQDAYGIDGFARMLSRSIAKANAAEGLVFAINGPWGSGKSSACNLVLHHLRIEIHSGAIIPIKFNPWWFSGPENLTFSFFQELSVPIGKSVSEQARDALSSLGRRISSVAPLLGPLATMAGMPGTDGLIVAGADAAAKLKSSRTVEEEHEKLAEDLRKQDKKFLVVIDDIDRLGPDEALLIFRLVKSVGRLPNVVYLLAFDRILAEQMIVERFPAEGANYLDKFIQGGFDLPLPDSHDLREAVLRVANDVMGPLEQEKATRFFNLFYEICAPLIRLPRDAVRLSNAIRVTWPVIGEEVDKADFLALECLRLFLPSVHKAIKSNPDLLCGAPPRDRQNRAQDEEKYETLFLSNISDRHRHIGRMALRRLFPRTDYIWGNVFHGERDAWRLHRLVCSANHFPTYFGFAVDEDAVAASEAQELIDSSSNTARVEELFRHAAQHRRRRRGGTRAALLLEELQVRAGTIPEQNIENLLRGLFAVFDEIDLDTDNAGAFSVGSNRLRLHWLLNGLLRDRMDQAQRGALIEAAIGSSTLWWHIDLAERCIGEYSAEHHDHEPMVAEDVARRISATIPERIRIAAADGTLAQHKHVRLILFRWRDMASPEAVRAWTDSQLSNDSFIVNFADRSILHAWSQGMGMFGLGDLVASRNDYVMLEQLADLLDVPRFRARVQELIARQDLAEEDRQKLLRFAATPERNPEQG